ncbi:MAG: hypothetical protein AAF985_09270 [Bacteroidota bacterium]
MKTIQFFTFMLLTSLLIGVSSCSKEEAPEFIDPADVEALSRVLILPDGSERTNGNPPAPSNSTNAPTVNNPLNFVTSSNGGTVPLEFNYGNVGDNLGGCYIQIPGTSSFFNVPYDTNSSSSGSLAVPVGIPANVLDGLFSLNFCVYDTEGQVSNVVTTQVDVLLLGTGSLQISLSWNTPTDQDLHVEDPGGEVIYFGNKTALSGGELDKDDTDGYGPENVYWLENAPDGSYQVSVDDYTGTLFPTTVYVTVSTPDRSKRFTATTSNGAEVDIVTIRKSGDNYEF